MIVRMHRRNVFDHARGGLGFVLAIGQGTLEFLVDIALELEMALQRAERLVFLRARMTNELLFGRCGINSVIICWFYWQIYICRFCRIVYFGLLGRSVISQIVVRYKRLSFGSFFGSVIETSESCKVEILKNIIGE